MDALRGLAATAVAWQHYTNSVPGFLDKGWLQLAGSYGWLGVEAFFVISGFIIPYALYRSAYKLKAYRLFLAKRLIRLEPPYLASVALTICLIYFGDLLIGRPHDARLTLPGILLHIGYLNVFFSYPWLNASYWTLAVECQYYLTMGLIFPCISSARRAPRLLAYILLASSCWLIPSVNFMFHYVFLFLLGIAMFQRHAGIIGQIEFWISAVVSSLGIYVSMGLPPFLAAVFAAVFISTWSLNWKIFLFLGDISYSLYLFHPTGVFAIVAFRQLGLV
ncbi:MAG: acyltransferase, partial [Acidobacteria bacterium]|nr:acyltransferase [Acidobacteriota bacterium]